MAEALVIVDFQNELTPGGALAVPHGDEIAGRISELLDSGRFDLVLATRDWHPPDHGSFQAQGGIWPPHCVQGTHGAELHDALDRARVDVIIDKGQDPQTEGYSGFQATELEQVLRDAASTGHGRRPGHRLLRAAHRAGCAAGGLRRNVDAPGVRGIDAEPGDAGRALDEVRQTGGSVVES